MKKNQEDIVLMAVASGRESSEGAQIKRYIGVGTCTVLAINPTKAELERILSTPTHPVVLEKDPEYITADGADVRSIRVDIYLKTVPEKCNGIDTVLKIGYFLKDQKRFNNDKTKVQVINVYGESTWLSKEDFQAKTIPEKMSFFQPKGMRAAWVGEEEITLFIKKLLNIPRYSVKKADGTIVIIDNPKLAECQLDGIPNYFVGNIAELKAAITSRKDNKIKIAFGVKTTAENKIYQDCFKEYPINSAVTDFSYLAKNLLEKQASGGYPNTYFGGMPFNFEEWTPTQSNLTTAAAAAGGVAPKLDDDWATAPSVPEGADDFPA